MASYSQFFYNENIEPVINHVFQYDIKSCYYRLLSNEGVSFPKFKTKLERNMYIGNMMRDNKDMVNYCQNQTNNIINEFIDKNKIKEHEIINIERDGILTKRYLTKNYYKGDVYPELRDHYDVYVGSYKTRKSMILSRDDKTVIKGVKYKTKSLSKFVSKYINLLQNQNVSSWFKILNKLRNEYFNTDDYSLFEIEDKDGSMFIIKNKENQRLRLTVKDFKNFDLTGLNIDRVFYFNQHLEGFIQNLLENLFIF